MIIQANMVHHNQVNTLSHDMALRALEGINGEIGDDYPLGIKF